MISRTYRRMVYTERDSAKLRRGLGIFRSIGLFIRSNCCFDSKDWDIIRETPRRKLSAACSNARCAPSVIINTRAKILRIVAPWGRTANDGKA